MSRVFSRKRMLLAGALSAVVAMSASNVMAADPAGWSNSTGFDTEDINTGAPGGRPQLILNEYNSVSQTQSLSGSDSVFGTVQGNGGNWMELVVRTDGLDMRGWVLEWENSDPDHGWVVFSQDSIWNNMADGTIITIMEKEDGTGGSEIQGPPGNQYLYRTTDTTAGTGFNGAPWIHVTVDDDTYVDHGGSLGGGAGGSFKIDNDNWKMRILKPDGSGTDYYVIQDWVGESETEFQGNIGNDEVGKLQGDVTARAWNDCQDYDAGDNSTFGAPNTWDSGNETQGF